MVYLSFRQQLLLFFLLFSLLLALVPHAGFGDDVGCWVSWATYGFEHGLGNVYQVKDNNYNPLYHYVLWVYGQLCGSANSISHHRHWLKAFTLVFDFAGAFWAASVVPERARRFGLVLLLLFNIGYLYNTLIWEQVDAIYSALAFGAVLLAVRQRASSSLLLFGLALAATTHAIIFVPPLLLLWVPQWRRRPGRAAWGLAAGAALGLLLVAPFMWAGAANYLPRIVAINLEAANQNPVLSMHCFNLWYWVAADETAIWQPDTQVVAGLSYHHWGLLLFAGSLALALAPVLLGAWRQLRSQAVEGAPPLPLVLLSTGLVPLLFAFFNTQMHERYWHASLLFLASYAFLSRNYWPFALVSVAYFLNLEATLRYFELHYYHVFPFNARFVAGLFALAIVLSFVSLYRLAIGPRAKRPNCCARAAAAGREGASCPSSRPVGSA
jgi:Gpi18-like mannosyltransferase